MNDLHSLLSSAMDYRITWCEQHRAEPYDCDWRIDPCLVIIYTAEAPYQLLIRDQEEDKRFEAQRGEALLVPAGTQHRLVAPACDIRGINIHFSLFGGIDVLSFYKTPYLVSGDQADGLAHSIEQLVSVIGRRSRLYPVDNPQPPDELNIGAIAQEHQLSFGLLSQIINFSSLRPSGHARLLLMKKLQPALLMIEQRLHRKLPVKQLAKACNLSSHRFSHLFKQTLGDSPHRFILKRRVEQAMSELAHSRHSVSEIAEQLGFYDQPHFTRLFKQHSGLSPAYYRQDIQRRVMGHSDRKIK